MHFQFVAGPGRLVRSGVALAAVVALGLSGCARIDASCTTNADCPKANTFCKIATGDSEGICVSTQKAACDKVCDAGYKCSVDHAGAQSCIEDPNAACTMPCGDGFKCQWTEPSWHMACAIDPSATVAVGIASPANGGALGGGTQTIVCSAKAPQLQTVTVHVKDSTGTTTDLATTLAVGSTTDYEATLDTTNVPEGDLTLTCDMSYGPTDALQHLTSDPSTVTLDKTAPTITSTPPDGWHQPAGSLTITATLDDPGARPSGVDRTATKLTIAGTDVAPTVNGNVYSFAIDLSTVAAPAGGGAVSYTISTADKAGNTATTDGSISLDDSGPTVALQGDPSTAWHGGDAATFTVLATVTSTGAPVDASSVKLALTDGTHAVSGAATGGDTYSFSLDASTLQTAGAEGTVPFVIHATDVAGNPASASGNLKLDEKGPGVSFAADTSWHGGAETVPVSVTIADDGSGVDATSVSVAVNGGAGQGCSRGTGSSYTCNVSTSGAPADATTPAYAFVVTAKDALGNRTTQNGSLQVDTQMPAVTVPSDAKWYAAGDSVTVTVTAVDAGSGLGTNVPALETVDTTNTQAAKSYPMTSTGANTFAVTIKPSDFLKPGVTVSQYAMHVRIGDKVGNEAVTPVSLNFDEQGPTVTVDADSKWYGRSAQLTVRAQFVDSGSGLALAPPTLTVTDARATSKKVYTGTPGGSGVFTFQANVSDFMPSGKTYSDFAFEIESADAVGNATKTPLTRKLDDQTPVISVSSDSTWHSRSGSMSVTATITDLGAMSGTAPTLETNDATVGGVKTYSGSASGNTYTFTFVPSDFLPDGVSNPAYGFLIRARDAAGNEATASLSRKLDDVGPTVQVNTDASWYARSQNINVTAVVSDAGSGLSTNLPTLTASDAAATTHKTYTGTDNGDGTFSFQVHPADFMPAGQTFASFGFQLDVADAVGNATASNFTRKLDDEAPSITVASDSGWYGKSQTVTVHATVSDSGSGLNATTVKLATNDLNGTLTPKTYTATCSGTDCSFSFQPSEFIKTGLTLSSFAFRLTAADALGNSKSVDVTRNFDDQPPVISLSLPSQKILRNNTSTQLSATISDVGQDATGNSVNGAGVAASSVVLNYTKKDGSTASITGSSQGGGSFTWNLDASDPQLNTAEGPVNLTFKANDNASNTASQGGSVTVTRVLWTFDSQTGARVNGSLAYSSGTLYFTANANGRVVVGGQTVDVNNVFALNTSSGALAWSASINGTPTGPVSVGATDVYLAYTSSTTGNLVAYPKTGGTADWTCNNTGIANGGLGIASLDWGDGNPVESVVAGVVAATAGRFYAATKNGGSCTSTSGNIGLGTKPSESTASVNGNRLWVGLAGGKVATTTFSVGGFDAVSISGVKGNSAIAVYGAALKSGGNGVTGHGGDLQEWSSGLVSQYDGTSTSFGLAVAGPPSLFDDSTIYFASDDGALFKFIEPTESPASGFPIALPNSPTGNSSVSIDSVGNVTVGTGDGFVRTYSSSGSPLWSYDTGTGAALTSPALSCSGVLYVGTTDGHVIALQGDGGGLKNNSSWPRYQHDNRNTGNLATAIYSGGSCQD